MNRPNGITRFQTLSAAEQALPSAELDNEYNYIYSYLNALESSMTTNISEWAQYAVIPLYVSGTSFTVTGDATGTFIAERRIRATALGAYSHSEVVSSAYVDPITTVVIKDSILDSDLAVMDYGFITSDLDSNSLPRNVMRDFFYDHSDLTDQASIETDISLANEFRVTLGGNRTLAAPTNALDGKRVIWRFKQDATGTRTITFATGAGGFRFSDTIPSVTLSTAANKVDYMGAIYNETDDRWDVLAFAQGY